ncbi:MAG: invasion associated locus B family protein [Pseudomonadota bacterium]
MTRLWIVCALLGFSLSAAVAPAVAQTAQALGQFRDWGAYVSGNGGSKMCFILSQPKDMEPKNVQRGDVFFYVTIRPGQGVRSEISIITGYNYRDGSSVTAEIGSDRFTLFTNQDAAWLDNAAEEERLITAMRAGQTMVIRGTSSRGTDTVDQYSLFGVSAALERAGEECQ